MPRTTSVLTFALASAVALACQPAPQPGASTTAPGSGVTIDVDRPSYRPGDRVELRITNHTNETLGFNPCTRSIERRQGDAWSLIVEADRVCTMQLYLLDAHATRTEATELPARLERGTYRLVLTFTRESAGVTPGTPASTIRATTPTFQVQ
jgi:hypothetical protein